MIGPNGKGLCCCGQRQEPIAKQDARRAWSNFLGCFATGFSAIQLLILVLLLIFNGGFAPMALNPMLGPHAYMLDDFGAKNASRMVHHHEWWRLMSPMLLHSGVLHLLGNVMVQLRLGVLLEIQWGHHLWLQVYMFSGLYASLASCCLLPNVLGVGPSGGICGLIGADIVFFLCTWSQTMPQDIEERNSQLGSLCFAVVLTLLVSLLPMVDFAAHAGGFVSGGLLGAMLFAERLQEAPVIAKVTQVTSTVLLLALFGATAAYLLFFVKPDSSLLIICRPPHCK